MIILGYIAVTFFSIITFHILTPKDNLEKDCGACQMIKGYGITSIALVVPFPYILSKLSSIFYADEFRNIPGSIEYMILITSIILFLSIVYMLCIRITTDKGVLVDWKGVWMLIMMLLYGIVIDSAFLYGMFILQT